MTLTKNCRNTFQIAQTSNNIIGLETNEKNSSIIQENKTNIIFIKDNEEEISAIEKVIKKYKEEFKVKDDDIAILTVLTEEKSILNAKKEIGKYNITNKENGKDIVFTTSRKFKGLEKFVIIIIDVGKEQLIDKKQKNVFYVATSRAKYDLTILANFDDKDVEEIAHKLNLGDVDKNSTYKKIADSLEANVVE